MRTEHDYRKILTTVIEDNDLESLLVALDNVCFDYPNEFDCRDNKGNTVLHIASSMQCLPMIIKTILCPRNRKYIGRIEDRDGVGSTALQIAAKEASLSVVIALINAGADVHARGIIQQTALHYACAFRILPTYYRPCTRRSEKIVALLLDNQTDIDALTAFGDTALLTAVFGGLLGVVRLLLKRRADVTICNPCVHYAIQYGHNPRTLGFGVYRCTNSSDERTRIDMLELVISHGADIYQTYRGRSAMEFAVSIGNRYAVRLLELILQEIPNQAEQWSTENIMDSYKAVAMSQGTRLGAGSTLHVLVHENISGILDAMTRNIPKTLASGALRALKERHGRLPILDTERARSAALSPVHAGSQR